MENDPGKIPEGIRFTLKKGERLCSKKQIEKLFAEGTSLLIYPLRMVYAETPLKGPFPAKVGFAVSRKYFKKAVTRNLIKRRMREAYRLNKYLLSSPQQQCSRAVMIIYVGKHALDFRAIEKAMKRSLSLIAKRVTPNP